jgi:putative transcriptional regulator
MDTGKERAADTQFGRDLIEALQDAANILRGEQEAAQVHLAPDIPDVRAIRTALGLSREAFATRFGLKATAVRDWEQGLRKPDPAARTLLKVIARNPEVVAAAVAA